MKRPPTSAGHPFFWAAVTAVALAAFIEITKELLEGEVGWIDRAILLTVAKARTPWLSVAAVDITALGSVTLVALFACLMLLVLLALHDRFGAAQLASTIIGAAILSIAAKDIIGRTRPHEIPPLVQVAGFSFPSGHSLLACSTYLTIAILAGHHLNSWVAKLLASAMAGILILLVALSRVYLGVHYPTDVASGVALGAAWAFFVAAAFSYLRSRAWASRP